KNPSHIDDTPDRLRHRWGRHWRGMMDWRDARAQISSSTTEGSPRNRTIWGSVAWWSEASLTNDPMTANIADASSIQRACMESAPGKLGVKENRYYTPVSRAPAGRDGTEPGRPAPGPTRTTISREGSTHEARRPFPPDQPGSHGGAQRHLAHLRRGPLPGPGRARCPGSADLFADRRLYRLDHLAAHEQADGQVEHRRARDRPAGRSEEHT